MNRVAMVRLREMGMINEFAMDESMDLKVGDYVIIEVDRGVEWGEVVGFQDKDERNTKRSLKRIIRKTTIADIKQIKENKSKARDSFNICNKQIKEKNINMKLIQGEYSFDSKKVIFYFMPYL